MAWIGGGAAPGGRSGGGPVQQIPGRQRRGARIPGLWRKRRRRRPPNQVREEAPFISAGSWIPIRIRGFIFIVEAPATKEKVKSPCLSIWM